MDKTSKKLLITTLILGVIALVSGITGVSLLKEPLLGLQKEMAQVLSEQIDTTINSNIDNTEYYVTNVIDGDTIEIDLNGERDKVRLIGIDTPELRGSECYAKEARAALRNLIEFKRVKLEADLTQANRDRYDRLLRYVYLDNLDINYEMIKGGYAKEYTYNKAYINQAKYRAVETVAKIGGSGIWGKC